MAVRLEDARFAGDHPHRGRLAAQTMSSLGGRAATLLRGLDVKLGRPEPVRATASSAQCPANCGPEPPGRPEGSAVAPLRAHTLVNRRSAAACARALRKGGPRSSQDTMPTSRVHARCLSSDLLCARLRARAARDVVRV